LHTLNDINIDESYNNRSPLMPMDPILKNNKIYEMNNDQTNQINYLGNASSSCSEPKLNSNGKYFDDGDDNNNKNNNNN